MKLTYFLYVLLFTVVIHVSQSAVVTISQENHALDLIKEDLHWKPFLIPQIVRFAFHVCFNGGCNGCINLNNPGNKGLENIFEKLNDSYDELKNTWKQNVMSRADFYAVASVQAARAGLRRDDALEIKYGRKDCPTSPYTDSYVDFPDGGKDMAHVESMIGKDTRFELSSREIVALVGGGHSVGAMNPRNSGFGLGPWDFTPFRLDNGFFGSINFTPFVQHKNRKGKYQWRSIIGTVMLNTDMSMYKNLELRSNGKAKSFWCRISQYKCKNTATTGVVKEFAWNGGKFKEEFTYAYQKMIDASDERDELEPASHAAHRGITFPSAVKSDNKEAENEESFTESTAFIGLVAGGSAFLVLGSAFAVVVVKRRKSKDANVTDEGDQDQPVEQQVAVNPQYEI